MNTKICESCKNGMTCVIGDFWICKPCDDLKASTDTRKRGTYPAVQTATQPGDFQLDLDWDDCERITEELFPKM